MLLPAEELHRYEMVCVFKLYILRITFPAPGYCSSSTHLYRTTLSFAKYTHRMALYGFSGAEICQTQRPRLANLSFREYNLIRPAQSAFVLRGRAEPPLTPK